jgi:hypothetical protein
MQVCGCSLRKNRVTHIDNQLQDLLIGRVRVCRCLLEFILGCTFGIRFVPGEGDLSRLAIASISRRK